MQIIRKHSSTSNTLRVSLRNSSTGAGLTGLTSASSGLIISTICDNEASATTYTVSGFTIESITTLGTFATPTATKCRFKEVDATNHPGLYEIQLDDARFAVSSAKVLRVTISGATNLLSKDVVIQLEQVPADLTHVLGTAATASGGTVQADMVSISGDSIAADNLEAAYENGLPFLVGQVNNAVTPTTTAFETDTASFTSKADGFFNNGLITFVSGNLRGVTCRVSDFVNSTNVFTVTTLPQAPANDDWFILIGRQTA